MAQNLSELMLISRIARAYYLEHLSKIAISERLSISRFRVARMLEAARLMGMVHVEIRSPGIIDTQLSTQLEDVFGLSHAIVLDVSADDVPALRGHLGRSTGQLLCELTTQGDVIGVSWARSLVGIDAGITKLPPCPVVQMTGAISVPDGSDVLELVRRVARAGHARSHVFYAPLIVQDTATAQSLRSQPDIARALEMVNTVTVAMVSIGAWRKGQSSIFDALGPAERSRNTDAGVVAEISGVFVGADGHAIDCPLSQRTICPTGRQLESIPNVIAVAYGVERVEGVRSVLNGSIVNGLVTHTSLARALLSGSPAHPSRP